MFGKAVWLYSFLLTFVQLIRITYPTFHDSGHGFIPKKARYFKDDLSHIDEMGINSLGYFQNVDSLDSFNLRFDPEVLDFREKSLGTPHSRTVTLYNTDSNKSIDLTSISGNTVHFHSSFFEDKQIPPNGNTSFKVVYLGRQEGLVESPLFLQTSKGFVKYNVKAFGTFNNYRVRPIVGVKLPINSTFTPVIYMHNPHSEPIQIVEIYSTGGGFHLELPSGENEGPNDLWEINPYETKAVIRVRFEAKVPHNHTAYIRIKLYNPDEILIVPLEVEVTQVQSVFHPQGHVDFGVGGSMDDPKEVDLCLFNPLRRAIRVHSVSTLSKSIKIQYYNVRINPGSDEGNQCVNVGTLTVDWRNAWQTQDYHGKIVVKFRSGKNRTEIPYFLTVLKGGLSYDKMSTTYFLNENEVDTKERNFEVLNEFFQPIKVLDVKFPSDVDTTFKVQTHTPIVVKPAEKKTLFDIWLKSGTKKTDMQLTSHIKILTNVSEINVPLLSYNGKLQIRLPFATEVRSLHLGLLGYHKKVHVFFTLINPNPIEIPLVKLSSNLPMSELELYGCGMGDHNVVLLYQFFENLTKCDKIASRGYAVIKLTIITNDCNGYEKGDVEIKTPFEKLWLPVTYKIAAGEIIIDQDDLVFDNCFPTKTCSHPLRIFSSFSEKMFVEHILTMPLDKRVSAAITGPILPKINQIIGHIYLNPDLDCSPECYTGLVNEGSASWLRTLVITKQVSEYDMKMVNTFYGRFLNFTHNGSIKTRSNVPLRLDTNEVKGKMFVSKINYTWPSLVKENSLVNSTLTFPLTQVRNSSFRFLTLHNPSNHNVVMQLLFENNYPHAEMLYDGLPSSFIPPSEVKFTSLNWFSFDFLTMEAHLDYFWINLRLTVNKHSLPLILAPGQSKRVTLEFTAEEARPYSTLLIIRNNLTILETVRLNGKGTIPRFEFASLKPGDTRPLRFDLGEKQLRSCNAELHQKPFLPSLTMKESFFARNLGEIPVQVTSFLINGQKCEGFGFKVVNCESFILSPNSSRRIDLLFTPDLTLKEVSRVLIIGTSLNTFVNYSLRATVSTSYCRHCSLLLDRPHWEIYMSYVVNLFLLVMLSLMVVISIIDANTMKNRAWEMYMASYVLPSMPVLDLRKIGRQVREEIQSSLKEKTVKTENACPDSTKLEDDMKCEPPVVAPAIVPTTGKAKRKFSQKISLTDREDSFEDEADKERRRERQRKKDLLYERHRLKSRERKTEKELRLLGDKGKKEKHVQQKENDLNRKGERLMEKKQVKKISAFGQEEEASSTTTESSHSSNNCDEVDKENQRLKWSKQRVNVSSQTMSETVATKEAQDGKIKHVSFVNSNLRHKVGKMDQYGKEQETSLLDKNDCLASSCNNREKRRRNQRFKERNDKLIFRHKNHLDRKQQARENESAGDKDASKNPSNFYVQLPASTLPCMNWCENRARFSDVVARNDQPNDPSPVSTQSSDSPQIYPEEDVAFDTRNSCSSPFKQQKAGGKPTMYVEPYKPIDLGPIGSKRNGTPESNSPDLFTNEAIQYPLHLTHPLAEFHPINDKSVIAAVANNTLIPGAGAASGLFGQSQPAFLPDDLGHVAALDASWPRQQVFQNITSSREESNRARLFGDDNTEVGGDFWRHPPTQSQSENWSNTFNSVLNSTSRLTNNAYLWGSPIWKPWTPSVSPKAVRRTPPGFDEQILQKKQAEEEQKRQQQQADQFMDGYGASSSSPWTRSGKPWD